MGTRNNNGERLVELCARNNLVTGGTLFTHRDIHKLTWISPNGRDRNQIDHLMINGMWRRSLLDVRTKRSADVGSDHHLVTALIQMKLKKTEPRRITQTRFDIQRLGDNVVRTAFISDLRNRFQVLQNLTGEQDVETALKQVAALYRERAARKTWAIERRRPTKTGFNKKP